MNSTPIKFQFKGIVLGPIIDYVSFNVETDMAVLYNYHDLIITMETLIPKNLLFSLVITDLHDLSKVQTYATSFGMNSLGIIFQSNRPRYSIIIPESIWFSNLIESHVIPVIDSLLFVQNDLIFNCLIDQIDLDQKFLCNEDVTFIIEELIPSIYYSTPEDKYMSNNIHIISTLQGGDSVSYESDTKTITHIINDTSFMSNEELYVAYQLFCSPSK